MRTVVTQFVLGCVFLSWPLLCAGCRKWQPVAVPPVQPTSVSAQPSETTFSAAATTDNPPTTSTATEIASPPVSLPPASAISAPSSAAAERILLLTPNSPLIVELRLVIDGQPHSAALERLVDEVLKLADSDGDGTPTWKELCASKRIKYGQFGNLPINDENGEKQIIERYDVARDGIVSRAELPRFLTRNAGGSRPFSIRGTFDHRDLNRRAAPTWRVIDADDDGVISVEEMKLSTARLASRDTDDDEILLANELNPRSDPLDPQMMDQRRRRGPDAVRLLGPHADWASVQTTLEQQYGGGRMLRPDSFASPELFAQLDKNKDGRLRRDELEALNEAPAQVIIEVAFGTGERQERREEKAQATEKSDTIGRDARNQPRLKVIYAEPQCAIEHPGRLTIVAGGVVLTFYTNDTAAGDDFAARAKQVLEMFDQNKDGYLESSEVPESLQAQFGRFEAVDANEDGKVYAEEIESFLAQQQAGLRAQIHCRVSDREDLLFAELDADADERLDSREMHDAPQRLDGLNGDGGPFTADKLREVVMIGLARGSLENADATFAPPTIVARAAAKDAPRWFTAMDANQDGAISRREFLGSADQFRELDKNSNGLIELQEVAAGH